MLAQMRQIKNSRSYCELQLANGENVYGFITRVNPNDFDIVILEPILPEMNDENCMVDEEGNTIILHPEEIDHVLAKHTYITQMVCGIVEDVTHRLKPNIVKSLSFMRDTQIFKPVVKKSKKRSKVYDKTQGRLTIRSLSYILNSHSTPVSRPAFFYPYMRQDEKFY